MATCKDCIHERVCNALIVQGLPYNDDKLPSEAFCMTFKDKSRFIELPCQPQALMKDNNPFNTDVYCPTCGTNLSGYYGGEPLSVIQCFNCGELLDNTRAITREEAEQALKERSENDA